MNNDTYQPQNNPSVQGLGLPPVSTGAPATKNKINMGVVIGGTLVLLMVGGVVALAAQFGLFKGYLGGKAAAPTATQTLGGNARTCSTGPESHEACRGKPLEYNPGGVYGNENRCRANGAGSTGGSPWCALVQAAATCSPGTYAWGGSVVRCKRCNSDGTGYEPGTVNDSLCGTTPTQTKTMSQ